MAEQWFRCEIRDEDSDELAGYFITLAERADGDDSATSKFLCLGEDDYVNDVVACDDPTIPNDYERTAALRTELENAKRDIETFRGMYAQKGDSAERIYDMLAKKQAELNTANQLIEALKKEMRDLGRRLVNDANVCLSVGKEYA